MGLIWIILSWNYPRLHNDSIEVRNIIFISFKYRYDRIKKIEIINYGRGPILNIKLKDSGINRRFLIACVHHKDLDKLSADLQQKGVNTIRKMSPFD